MRQDPHAPYTVFKADVSYFSGKLEAYLRYKGIPHDPREVDFRSINFEVFQHTGFKKVPAVRSADDLWLFDTTPTILWFETHYPEHPVLPGDPALRFLCLLLEDYADEWLWRPAMWWRWEYRASRLAAGWRIGGLAGFGGRLVQQILAWQYAWRQRREWLWGDGVDRNNASCVRDLYLEELKDLQAILQDQPYLLGSHPSLADFGYFGPMFRHFSNDPDPAEVMRREAPAVYEWTARLWNAKGGPLGNQPQWFWPQGPHWQRLMDRISGDYLPYLEANANAWQQGRKRFDFNGKSICFQGTITTQYRVWCRQNLRREWGLLSSSDQERVQALCANPAGLQQLGRGPDMDSGLDDALAIPKSQRTEPRRQSLLMWLWGQARN